MEQKSIIYWKPEPKERKWLPIPNTPTQRDKAIKNGAMFFTWAALSAPYTGNGQPEPVRYGDMPLDFDCREEPGRALYDVRKLCLVHLPELYDIDPYELEFYCSGSKGFHVVIPAKFLGAQAGHPQLPCIYKKITEQWGAQFNLTTLDHTLYSMKKGKMFRIANIRRENGRYKVSLSLEEIKDLSIEAIEKLSEEPRHVD